MKQVIGVIIIVLGCMYLNEVHSIAPPYKPGGAFMPFMDGVEYHVTTRYYVKEITNAIVAFCMALSLSILVASVSLKASIFFWILAFYRIFYIFMYVYNHCSWPVPFYVATLAMTGWAIYLFKDRRWMKMKVVR